MIFYRKRINFIENNFVNIFVSIIFHRRYRVALIDVSKNIIIIYLKIMTLKCIIEARDIAKQKHASSSYRYKSNIYILMFIKTLILKKTFKKL